MLKPDRELFTLHLNPGDHVQVTTEGGVVYQIEPQSVIDGLLRTTVRRVPVEKPNLRVAAERYEESIIISGSTIGAIAIGQSMDVVGIEATSGQRTDFRTTSVETIENLPLETDSLPAEQMRSAA